MMIHTNLARIDVVDTIQREAWIELEMRTYVISLAAPSRWTFWSARCSGGGEVVEVVVVRS